jgi:hypothetical protein
MTTKQVQQLTVAGVSALINKIATDSIANKVVSTPVMQDAFAAVLALIESKSAAPEVTAAIAKVRKAVGIAKPTEQQQKETNA